MRGIDHLIWSYRWRRISHSTHWLPLPVCKSSSCALSSNLALAGRVELDALLLKSSKTRPVLEFSSLLEFCSASLAGEGLSSQDLACVVHLSTLLLSETPQGNCLFLGRDCSSLNMTPLGTLKIVQGFTTNCLNLFAGHPLFHAGPLPLRLEVLAFTVQHCSDRVGHDPLTYATYSNSF